MDYSMTPTMRLKVITDSLCTAVDFEYAWEAWKACLQLHFLPAIYGRGIDVRFKDSFG